MKTIPMVPACQNMEELHKLTDLICEYIHPQMVICSVIMQVWTFITL